MTEKANFKVDPRLAKLLGASYRSTEYALKELVDNAWDAEDTLISITLPEPMTLESIVIKGNENGMTEQELRREYLTVANDRRSRKGIGKFAGLMVVSVMDVKTTARKRQTQAERDL